MKATLLPVVLLAVAAAIAQGETDLVLRAELAADLAEQEADRAWEEHHALKADINRLRSSAWNRLRMATGLMAAAELLADLEQAELRLGRMQATAHALTIQAATIRAAAKLLAIAHVEDICSAVLRPDRIAVSAGWLAVSQATVQIEYDLEKLCKRLKASQGSRVATVLAPGVSLR